MSNSNPKTNTAASLRRAGRERALQNLYTVEVGKQGADEVFAASQEATPLDEKTEQFARRLLDVTLRCQPEIDPILQWQIRIAAGEKLTLGQRDVDFKGHAIECRVTAQDPAKGFSPAAGTLRDVRLPGGLGVRVDTQIFDGYTVPPFYDANLAKIIVWGPDRPQAIARMRASLGEMNVGGIPTNIPFLQRILSDERYVANEISTAFLPALMTEAGLTM